jgi:hypothetical protein
VSDPEAASLCSDNVDALVTWYNRLTTDEERNRFIAALTTRLEGDKGYVEVAYFIICVLLKISQLGKALQKAKQELPTGEQKAFGLSNVLVLLNGLLKYRHPDFTTEMLDDIERLIHNLNEHPFMIPQKLSAIRTSRLAKAWGTGEELVQQVIPRHTEFRLPATVEAIPEPGIQDIFAALGKDRDRLALIVGDVLNAVESGCYPLVLTGRREQVDQFEARLKESIKNVVILRGGMGRTQRQAVREEIAGLP